MKGMGGFSSGCDATNDAVLKRLRILKHRPSKPFAVMFKNLDAIKEACVLSVMKKRALALASPDCSCEASQ